jgi:hypothetical protein
VVGKSTTTADFTLRAPDVTVVGAPA